MDERDIRIDRVTRRMNSWRAGCGESRTSGSASGPGKRAGPKGQRRAPARLNVVLVSGTRTHAEGLQEEVAAVLRPMGLRLSVEKTRIVHIDEGLDFLGFRIQRHQKRGTAKRFVYTYPSKKALASIKAKVRSVTRGATDQSLDVLLHRLNPVLRGWTNYFRHGVSKATFNYLRAFTWRRVVCWLRHKHYRVSWRWLRRRYLPRWWPTEGEVVLFDPAGVAVTRYAYRAARIASPWATSTKGTAA